MREKIKLYHILKSESHPPENDAIGTVTNRYFHVTVESGRVPHGEDSTSKFRETNL
jgi:hypothetical protein